jgi:hypothetical protein
VVENRALRRIFGPKGKEAVGGRRILNSEELHNIYTSPNNIRVFKSRRIRWTGHTERMEEMRNSYEILV